MLELIFGMLNPLGLAGKTPIEEAFCDMFLDAQVDLLIDLRPWFIESDEAKRVRLLQ